MDGFCYEDGIYLLNFLFEMNLSTKMMDVENKVDSVLQERKEGEIHYYLHPGFV